MSRHTARHLARRSGLTDPIIGVALATAVVFVATVLGAAMIGDPRATSSADPGSRAAASPATRPAAERDPQSSSPSPAAVGKRVGAVTPEPPRRAVLPSGADVPVVPVSTTADGTLDVPGDINVAGWWRGGSRLGDPFGSTLLSAHVDSTEQGLGPYGELLTVTAGQRIVLESRHLRQEFRVSSLRLLDKGPLSDHAWVYSASGPHRLTMVTCAGPYDAARGGYQRLAVVTAEAVGAPVEVGS